jgi:hypothetical protein
MRGVGRCFELIAANGITVGPNGPPVERGLGAGGQETVVRAITIQLECRLRQVQP